MILDYALEKFPHSAELRDGTAIGLRVPLDPNEGWNAYHALAAMTGAPLYPRGLMVNIE